MERLQKFTVETNDAELHRVIFVGRANRRFGRRCKPWKRWNGWKKTAIKEVEDWRDRAEKIWIESPVKWKLMFRLLKKSLQVVVSLDNGWTYLIVGINSICWYRLKFFLMRKSFKVSKIFIHFYKKILSLSSFLFSIFKNFCRIRFKSEFSFVFCSFPQKKFETKEENKKLFQAFFRFFSFPQKKFKTKEENKRLPSFLQSKFILLIRRIINKKFKTLKKLEVGFDSKNFG